MLSDLISLLIKSVQTVEFRMSYEKMQREFLQEVKSRCHFPFLSIRFLGNQKQNFKICHILSHLWMKVHTNRKLIRSERLETERKYFYYHYLEIEESLSFGPLSERYVFRVSIESEGPGLYIGRSARACLVRLYALEVRKPSKPALYCTACPLIARHMELLIIHFDLLQFRLYGVTAR